ncbi:hypothetical protein R6Y95_03180 [Methanoculleus palmolei]|uniref:Uncharacterized protein n=1 Tax=Methanoculleus palmolei TaxID=72612 RepID=A0ABD8AA09_9EURY|nr:hypothetical protein R6Y95_03180 [Methanoculleus palmolei]
MRHLTLTLFVGAARNRVAFDVHYLDDGHWIILAHGGKTAVPIPATVENARLRAGVPRVLQDGTITLRARGPPDDGGAAPVRPSRPR